MSDTPLGHTQGSKQSALKLVMVINGVDPGPFSLLCAVQKTELTDD